MEPLLLLSFLVAQKIPEKFLPWFLHYIFFQIRFLSNSHVVFLSSFWSFYYLWEFHSFNYFFNYGEESVCFHGHDVVCFASYFSLYVFVCAFSLFQYGVGDLSLSLFRILGTCCFSSLGILYFDIIWVGWGHGREDYQLKLYKIFERIFGSFSPLWDDTKVMNQGSSWFEVGWILLILC